VLKVEIDREEQEEGMEVNEGEQNAAQTMWMTNFLPGGRV
jgi:hypothetical protein